MKDGNGGLLLILGLVALGWWLRGRSIRRRMQMAYAPPPVWGGQYPRNAVSAKGVLAVIVLVTGVLFGMTALAGADTPKAGHKSAGKSAGMLESLFGQARKLPRLTVPAPGTPPPASGAKQAVRFVLAQRGDRYVYGHSGPNAWDCSGLTSGAWKAAGVSIPRTAQGQLDRLRRVKGKLRAGDLVIYRSPSSPSGRHVAMVVAPGQIVEARGRRWGVVQTRLRGGWLGAVRPGVR